MPDVPSRLADRRCPRCGAVQPLYVARSSGPALQRGPADVVPCPGCGVPVLLEADPGDPGGVIAGVLMIVALTGAILATVVWAAQADMGSGWAALIVAGIVALGVGLAMLWNARTTRRRRVVVVVEGET